MVAHNTLTDPELHEPKGISTAISGSVYTANGSGSGVWTIPTVGPTFGTAQTPTTATATFTGIPSTAKIITIILSDLSTNGSSAMVVRAGSGSIDSASYSSIAETFVTGSTTRTPQTNTTGYIVGLGGATSKSNGIIVLRRLNASSNTWISTLAANSFDGANYFTVYGSGAKTYSGILDRVQVTTIGGTDLFDAGSINITWE